MIAAACIVAAVAVGALWRRWLGMARENAGLARPYQVAAGIGLALLTIAVPAIAAGGWSLGPVAVALAPIAWLTAPAELSNFWIADLLARAPWRWPGGALIESDDFAPHLRDGDYPRPWAEIVAGGLGFGVAAAVSLIAFG